MVVIIAGLFILIIVEVIAYVIYSSGSFKDLKKFYNTLLKRNSGIGDVSTFTFRYAEHPFLGFSLNPEFRNSLGEKIHNKYGFRSKDDFANIDKKIVIYCAGGSSVYCNYIERNEDTWPNLLEKGLKETAQNAEIRVVNGACGGWTSYQSLIRFTAWVDILKPRLVIIYHGKNDFAPFVSGNKSETEIFPDYGNVMYSLRLDDIAKRLPILAKFSYTGKVLYGAYVNHRYMNILSHVYGLKKRLTQEEASNGLKRIGAKEWEFIISRYKAFAAICKGKNIPILFVCQKVTMDLYKPYMEKLNRGIKELECQYQQWFIYDFDKEVQDQAGLLYDHVHFTRFGAQVCAEHIKNYIINNILLFKE